MRGWPVRVPTAAAPAAAGVAVAAFLLAAFLAAAFLLAAAASAGPTGPKPCPATCIHVGSSLNPPRASAAVGAPIGFLAVDGRRHRIRSAFFSVTAIRGKNPPVVRLSAGSYGYRDSAGAGKRPDWPSAAIRCPQKNTTLGPARELSNPGSIAIVSQIARSWRRVLANAPKSPP